MSQEFDWDTYIKGRIEGAKADALERVIAHVLALDEGDMKNQGLEAIRRAPKTVCHTLVAADLLAKYAPNAHQDQGAD